MVYIYEVLREWTTHVWLCDACADKRRADRWTLRSRRIGPPRLGHRVVLTVFGADGEVESYPHCPADLDDRVDLPCQDCHLAELEACPSCGGPVVFPGGIGFDPCHDPAHVETKHEPAVRKLGTKGGGKKPGRPRRVDP